VRAAEYFARLFTGGHQFSEVRLFVVDA
jgi:hypothetical protein